MPDRRRGRNEASFYGFLQRHSRLRGHKTFPKSGKKTLAFCLRSSYSPKRCRDVAQFGRVQRSGRWGRWFKSCHPDHSEIRPPRKLGGFFVFGRGRHLSSVSLSTPGHTQRFFPVATCRKRGDRKNQVHGNHVLESVFLSGLEMYRKGKRPFLLCMTTSKKAFFLEYASVVAIGCFLGSVPCKAYEDRYA